MTQLVIINKEEVRQILHEIFLEETRRTVNETDFMQRLNRKEAAAFLGVSYQTLGKWTKKGWATMHGQGRKGYYLKSELLTIKQ